jgi:hypothetical protein
MGPSVMAGSADGLAEGRKGGEEAAARSYRERLQDQLRAGGRACEGNNRANCGG